jgi:hypothetical protein
LPLAPLLNRAPLAIAFPTVCRNHNSGFMEQSKQNKFARKPGRTDSFYQDRFLMAKSLYLLIAVTAALGLYNARAADEEKPQGRVCISVVDGPSGKEEAFKAATTYRPGSTVRAHVDASNKCTVLIAALTKDGKLANGWRPQLSEVAAEFEDIELPKAPVTWDWAATSASFDLYVLFLSSSSKEVEEAKKLVAAMEAPKMDERLLAMQTNKLRELIGRITSEKEKVNQAPMTDPEVGGVFRGAGEAAFPWRQFAQSINFGDDRPGVLVLSSEGAKNSP